ncbi:type IV pilus assembly protein PilM [Fodinisporobacter ferrooxydans]|uniref:Type IV pilus assembly protein PilM n=1 Tax=Fodinisporobacter ferrooxydans TaxID=2901836 RepID=A0ABY4CI08_9BACL|nr:type IV pilus assembly protein PilM [Alicyclobacillaceae bacterium MYW30-H2]
MIFGKTACIGIEITDSDIHAVEVVRAKNRVQILRALEIPLEAGIVVDGDVQQPEELGFLLREQFKLANLKAKIVRVVVPSRYVVIRQISMPKISKHDIRQAIAFELEHSIHLPFDESVFDFVKLNIPSEGASGTDVSDEDSIMNRSEADFRDPYIVVAASKEIVERMVQAVETADRKVKTVDVRALSLYRLYTFSNQNASNETILFVDIAEAGTDIHIFRNGFLLFTRNVPLPLDNYRKHESQTFYLEPAAKSEQMRAGDAALTIDALLFAQDLAYEIERSINFYQYTLNNRDQYVSRLILSGNVFEPQVLTEYFKSRLDLEVNLISSRQMVWQEGEYNDETFRKHAVAIGLAIREDKRTWK